MCEDLKLYKEFELFAESSEVLILYTNYLKLFTVTKGSESLYLDLHFNILPGFMFR
jgi:hypothetical protein